MNGGGRILFSDVPGSSPDWNKKVTFADRFYSKNFRIVKKALSYIFWLAVGGFFLFLTLRGKPLDEMMQSISQANLFWVAMNGVAVMLAFMLKGYRWKLLLQNAGENPSFIYVLYALCMGFFVNSFTPRLGEIVRCTSLKKSAQVPVSKSLATMVTERIWDVLFLVLGLVIVFILELDRLAVVWDQLLLGLAQLAGDHALAVTLAVLGLGLLVLLVIRVLRRRKVFEKGRTFLLEFWHTLRLSFRIKKYPRFLLVTVLIWIVLTFMNLFSLLALEETSGYSLYFAFVVVFVAGIGWAIPSPSGIGTTHFIVLQLFLAFQLPEQAGVAYGVLSNGLTFIYTILIGGVSLLTYELLSRRNNKQQKAAEG